TQVLDPFSSTVIQPVNVHPEQLAAGACWVNVLGTALAPLEMAQPFANPRTEAETVATEAAA
ncbi:MAG: hypothetical protein NZ843_01530, partial [Fimbriimonadales bacterium]|nr:hypothetical protein [Fimbriimonadales bacterium]